ncbi:tetratricopeptide repeat protein [Tenacibaculum caenipelagi]|uniref:Tetratricopeptide repeat protein n=1 Tax=Tenacibaculum caenipelagi TaxID=1325435 RepID=A0A4R6TB39_9FLAO|nr:tetratricopeptide repeat protein [Tenacibaculum caenipelagi]TDQ22714.1 tetratricopeptide repeat protein [Tenacibaculum caenipelagi]
MAENVEQLNNEGVKLFLKGNIKEAKSKYNKALKINPLYAATLNNLGMVSLQEKNFIKATNYFKNALKIKESATYFLNLGHAYANLNSFKLAEGQYIKAIDKAPDSLMGYKSLASLYQVQKQYDESVKVWEYIIANLSHDVSFKLHLAKDYIQLKEYQSALSVLYEASKQEKQQELTWYYISLIHFNSKNFGLAETAVKNALHIKPKELSFKSLLAAIHLGLSDVENAIKQWDEILAIEPFNDKIRIDKGVTLLSQGFIKESLNELNIVLRNDSKNEKANYYKAIAFLEANKLNDAISILNSIVNTGGAFKEGAEKVLNKVNKKS